MPIATLLLVEDNATDRLMVESQMRVFGKSLVMHCVQSMMEAQEAIIAFAPVDVIVLDLLLPDTPGPIETLKRVQELAPMVPVIVLSGLPRGEIYSQAVAEGAMQVLTKGEGSSELPAAVLSALHYGRRTLEPLRIIKCRVDAIMEQLNREVRERQKVSDEILRIIQQVPQIISRFDDVWRFQIAIKRIITACGISFLVAIAIVMLSSLGWLLHLPWTQ